jgi:hypothetical protein
VILHPDTASQGVVGKRHSRIVRILPLSQQSHGIEGICRPHVAGIDPERLATRHVVSAHNHRPAIMDLFHEFVRCRGHQCERFDLLGAVLEPVPETCKGKWTIILPVDEARVFLLPDRLPFVEYVRKHQAATGLERRLEHRFLRDRLRSGIDGGWSLEILGPMRDQCPLLQRPFPVLVYLANDSDVLG